MRSASMCRCRRSSARTANSIRSFQTVRKRADKNQELIDLALNEGRSRESALTAPPVEKRPAETVISLNAPTLKQRRDRRRSARGQGIFLYFERRFPAFAGSFRRRFAGYFDAKRFNGLNNVIDEETDESTNEYQVNLNGGEIGGNIHIHSVGENILKDIPGGLPQATGTEYLEINSAADLKNVKDWAAVASITVNAANLTIPIPAGNYQDITLNAPNKLVFAGGDYNFSNTIVLSKGSSIQIGGKTTVGIGGNLAFEDASVKLGKDVQPEDVKFNILGSSVITRRKERNNRLTARR